MACKVSHRCIVCPPHIVVWRTTSLLQCSLDANLFKARQAAAYVSPFPCQSKVLAWGHTAWGRKQLLLICLHYHGCTASTHVQTSGQYSSRGLNLSLYVRVRVRIPTVCTALPSIDTTASMLLHLRRPMLSQCLDPSVHSVTLVQASRLARACGTLSCVPACARVLLVHPVNHVGTLRQDAASQS